MSVKEIKKITADWVATPPSVYMKFKEAIENPDSSFSEFSAILSGDPGLLARLLKIVNSPYYGLAGGVETVEHAMTIVGLTQLSELVLATTVMKEFEGIPQDMLKLSDFWEHSLAVGIAAQLIATHRKENNVERFYIAGMLHDIGVLAICKKAPEKMVRALALCRSEQISLHEAERKIMGFSHVEVGVSLLKAWNLPVRLLDAVGYHHNPTVSKRNPLESATIHLADWLAYDLSLGDSGQPFAPELDENVLSMLEIDKEELSYISQEVADKFADAVTVFL
jgi:putative nucleotidyltransferase with HDIG domain